MKLIIVRHAAAIERTADVPEELRYLTSEGRSFARKTARTMLKNGIEPSLILSSPLVRAVQTADILAETLSYIGSVVVTGELAPGFDRAAFLRILDTYRQVDELLLVGHEPDLGSVVSELLFLRERYSFKKGTAVNLKCDDCFTAPATFKWLAAGKKLITSRDEVFSR
ncbi:MAG: histidine phosphatase family protein [Desulfuromonadales bacterium]|nr:histidine phosphatase family protein [Desulfuromonadales bacterium]